MRSRLPPFNKYDYYTRSVQSPDVDCAFLAKLYKQLRGRPATALREDFCGTFANCCEWVRRNRANSAIGVDLDGEPLAYGRENHLTKLNGEQQRRLELIQGSVLTVRPKPVDIVMALNFSFYIFKSRVMLRQYFKNALRGLKSDGLFVVDCFGGGSTMESNIETSRLRGFQYQWEQMNFNPISHEAKFEIHFKRKGERIRKGVFKYDWRMWTIPEVREAMLEAGFVRAHCYWEGTTRSGDGDGNFKRREVGEECDAWIAYVVGEA